MTTDATTVVALLDQHGPRSIKALRDHPALAGWSRDRVERAVVEAWSSNQVSIDAEDHLIAL